MNKRKILLFAVLIGIIAAIRFTGVGSLLTVENLQRNREVLQGFVSAHPARSLAAFTAFYVVCTALSVPGAAILSLAAGFLFGTAEALLGVTVGATTGATLAFLSARYLIGGWVQARYESRLRKFNDELTRNGHRYLLTLRLIPIIPFFMINFFAALTTLPLKTFILTTAVGIIPGSLLFVFAGSRLAYIKSAGDVFSWPVMAAFAALALFALAPIIHGKIKAKRTGSVN